MCCRDEESAGGSEARYVRAYEAKVNPFAEFQKNEMESRVSENKCVWLDVCVPYVCCVCVCVCARA